MALASLSLGGGQPNPLRGGAPRRELPRPLDRAPRLRRIAKLIDEQAERSKHPARARALACAMRLRAAELEAGSEAEEQLEDAMKLLRELAAE